MEQVKIFVSGGKVRWNIDLEELEDSINNWLLTNSKKISITRVVQSQSEQRGDSCPVITVTIFYEAKKCEAGPIY